MSSRKSDPDRDKGRPLIALSAAYEENDEVSDHQTDTPTPILEQSAPTPSSVAEQPTQAANDAFSTDPATQATERLRQATDTAYQVEIAAIAELAPLATPQIAQWFSEYTTLDNQARHLLEERDAIQYEEGTLPLDTTQMNEISHRWFDADDRYMEVEYQVDDRMELLRSALAPRLGEHPDLQAAIHEVEAASQQLSDIQSQGTQHSTDTPMQQLLWWQLSSNSEDALTNDDTSRPMVDQYVIGLRDRHSPFAQTALRDSVNRVFGRALSEQDMERLTGAQPGDTLRIFLETRATTLAVYDAFHVRVTSPSDSAQNTVRPGVKREISFDVRRYTDGKVVIANPSVYNYEAKSASNGRDIIHTIQTWQQLGVNQITASAIRERGANGYRTWALIGFQGEIPLTGSIDRTPHNVRAEAQARFGSYLSPGEQLTRVEQLMCLPGGVAWWKRHGVSWEATFDFTPGSYSMQTLEHFRVSRD